MAANEDYIPVEYIRGIDVIAPDMFVQFTTVDNFPSHIDECRPKKQSRFKEAMSGLWQVLLLPLLAFLLRLIGQCLMLFAVLILIAKLLQR